MVGAAVVGGAGGGVAAAAAGGGSAVRSKLRESFLTSKEETARAAGEQAITIGMD